MLPVDRYLDFVEGRHQPHQVDVLYRCTRVSASQDVSLRIANFLLDGMKAIEEVLDQPVLVRVLHQSGGKKPSEAVALKAVGR